MVIINNINSDSKWLLTLWIHIKITYPSTSHPVVQFIFFSHHKQNAAEVTWSWPKAQPLRYENDANTQFRCRLLFSWLFTGTQIHTLTPACKAGKRQKKKEKKDMQVGSVTKQTQLAHLCVHTRANTQSPGGSECCFNLKPCLCSAAPDQTQTWKWCAVSSYNK